VLIESDQLSSVILWGPPGIGKTSLAEVMATQSSAHFVRLSAVSSGVKDIRETIAQAQHLLGEKQRRTIAIEYINASTARNKAEIEERDPVQRKKTQDALRATAADPAAARAYLRKSSMLDALTRAEAIA
jgi:ATP-dependent 26S proteasome regulatory subunit